jgi:hypothetical protein
VKKLIAALTEALILFDGIDNGYCRLCSAHRYHDREGVPEACPNPECWSNKALDALGSKRAPCS